MVYSLTSIRSSPSPYLLVRPSSLNSLLKIALLSLTYPPSLPTLYPHLGLIFFVELIAIILIAYVFMVHLSPTEYKLLGASEFCLFGSLLGSQKLTQTSA